MEQFLNFIDVLIVWMSFYLSIYYVKKDNYKKIKYRIAKKDDKYLVVIWNASLTTIYKEDLYFLYLLVNTEAKYDCLYKTDKDVPLIFKKGKDHVMLQKHRCKLNLAFNFLNSRNGYLMEINNIQKSTYLPGKLGIKGRIRGQNKSSVVPYFKMFKGLNGGIKASKDRIGKQFINCLLIIISLLCTFAYGYDVIINGNDHYFFLSIALILLGVSIYYVYMTSMPYKLKKAYFTKIKKDKYKEITNLDDLINSQL